MLPVLQSLLILQDRDVKLRRTEKELAHLPIEEKAIGDKLHAQLTEFNALKLRTQHLESERKDLDNQVLAKKTNIAKYKAQQFETRNNDQFQALNTEIDRAEKSIILLEDQELELMEKYELAQKDVATESVRVKEFEKAALTRKADLSLKKTSLESLKQQAEKEAAELASQIDPIEVGKYRRLLASKGDVAIVPVENGANCGGCHMKLTQQTVHNAKAAVKLATCENCGRFVYWVA